MKWLQNHYVFRRSISLRQTVISEIDNKGGTKRKDKVWERIGRLKEKYASIHQYYQIKVLGRESIMIATGLVFKRTGELPGNETEGIYFLRTSLDSKEEQTLWAIYNTIREIEYAFGVLTSDLDLRPIFHKTYKYATH